MANEVPIEVIAMSSIAFGMGFVKAVITPERRGLLGFFAAMVVAAICGLVAGVICSEFGASSGWQYVVVAAFAVIGDQIVFVLMQRSVRGMTTNITNNTTFGDGASVDTLQTGDNARRTND